MNLYAKHRHGRTEQTGKLREERTGGVNWELGIDIYTLLCIKWITNEKLLYTQGEEKKVQSVCRTYTELALKMHYNIHWVQTDIV